MRYVHSILYTTTVLLVIGSLFVSDVFGQEQQIAASLTSIAFVCPDGTVYSVGQDDNEIFGDGEGVGSSPSKANIPESIVSFTSNCRQTFVAVGTSGTCYAWSWFATALQNINGSGTLHPVPIGLEMVKGVQKVVISEIHALFLHTDSTLSASGDNRWGQLGTGTTDIVNNAPTACTQIQNEIVDIAAGFAFTIALDADGVMHGWGNNTHNALSTELIDTILHPVVVRPEIGRVVAIWCGRGEGLNSPIVALTDHGDLYGWAGIQRTFGIADIGKVVIEPHLLADSSQDVKDVAVGQDHLLVLTGDGVVFAAGINMYGTLGQGDREVHLGLNRVWGLPPISRIYAAPNTSIAVDTAGGVWLWGFSNGLTNPDAAYLSPTRVTSPCALVGVAEHPSNSEWAAIQSLTSRELTLVFDDPFSCASVEIFNLNGEIVAGNAEVGPNTATVDISNYPTGVYIAVVQDTKRKQVIIRFSVLR